MEKIFTIEKDDIESVWNQIKRVLEELSKKYNMKMSAEETSRTITVERTGFNGKLDLAKIVENTASSLKLRLLLNFSWFVPATLRNNILGEIESFINKIK